MNRVTSFLTLSAIVIAGAFAGTAAQASAGNVNADFKVHNGDASQSMLRVGTTSSYMSGLINPPASILAGGDDPSSGFAVFSAPAPAIHGSVQGNVSYANASDGLSNLCTFTITITRTAANAYTLQLSVPVNGGNCSVPGGSPPTNLDGQFTSSAYQLTWST